METGAESGGKHRTSVGSDSPGYSMQTNDIGYIQLCKFVCSVSGADRDEVRNLGESVHYNPDGVFASLSPRQSGDEVHANIIPFHQNICLRSSYIFVLPG